MTRLPDWDRFTPARAEEELARLLAESEKAVAAVENGPLDSFESVFHALEDATRSLWREWTNLTHMAAVMNSDRWREVEERFTPEVVGFSLRVGQSRVLYGAMKALLSRSGENRVEGVRRRILEKAVQSAEHAGVALEDGAKSRFNAIQARLAKLATDFSNAVVDATAAFSFEKDLRTYTIDDAEYPQTMKHCQDAAVRETLFRARSSRAPENDGRITEILALRKEMAAILGFADYAEMSISSKSAPSRDAVMKMIDDLDVATVSLARREEEELGGSSVKPWDLAFLAERLRERKYSYSEEELKRHFDLPDVLRGLFEITRFLFGVETVEIKGERKPPVWHPDVMYFSVRENGTEKASFYFDPYVRNGLKRGGAWMNEFASRSDRTGEKPLAVIVMNLPRPDADGRCFMPMREVETLFHEFGHALQCMLTDVGEAAAAGINLVEWDAVEVASQFMENWCLDRRTRIEIPEELKRRVRAAKNFRAAYACRRQLAFAKTDMLLHSGSCGEGHETVKKKIFSHFGVPMVEEDKFLCSFTHIFAGGYAAGYYGYKWAEVMSADCYGAFEEAGIDDDEAVKAVGLKYRGSVLSLGGSLGALEVFRRFRRRDPEIDALMRQTFPEGACGR